MTKNNEQIIIDDVDVSGCDFLAKKDDYCSYSGVTYAYKGQCMCSDEEMCKEHPKCFYKKVLKQLKRKEQECEELKEKLIKWLGKEGLRQSEKEFYEQQLDQLKQTLEEIREIAKKSCCLQSTSVCEDNKNCKECGRVGDDEAVQQILQKIDEVIDE